MQMSISLHLQTYGAVVTDVTALFDWLFLLSLLPYNALGYRCRRPDSESAVDFGCVSDS